MPGKTLFFLLVFPVLFSFQGRPPGSPSRELIRIYRQAANAYSDPQGNERSFRHALLLFDQFIEKAEKDAGNPLCDSLQFEAWFRKGILLDMLRNSDAAAKAYCRAIRIQKGSHSLSDSLAFLAYSYAGSSYYNLNNFDSSNFFLQQAQTLMERFPNLRGKESVYNTLGVLYYDNGNYIQSRNYFNRALDIIESRKPLDTASAVSIETNIATSLFRLGLFEEALASYHKIEKYHLFTHFICMNMGRANSALGKYSLALKDFRKVDPRKIPGVCNEMAYAQFAMNKPDSALYYLDQLVKTHPDGGLNKLDLAINKLYRAELLMARGRSDQALPLLQDALIIFSGHFENRDPRSNPNSFTGTFAYYWLFEALVNKAQAFEYLFNQEKKEDWLLQSFAAYKTVLALLDYIEKSYDTDDAKLFLKKKSWQIYPKALATCLALNHLHPDGHWLEEAFVISEKNKASVITANLKENNLAAPAGVDERWLQEERNIKFNIARLNINSDQTQDSVKIDENMKSKARYEIALGELQKRIEQNNAYYRIKYEDDYPTIPELQANLSRRQALVSFYFAADCLHAFVLTRSSFRYLHLDSLGHILPALQSWLAMLKDPEDGRKFKGEKTGRYLSELLIKPVQAVVPDCDEWVIIPDGPLCFLPFESLPDGSGEKSLLETTAVSYQFSSRLMVHSQNHQPESFSGGVLAFAPFSSPGVQEEGPDKKLFESLPASAEEISGLKGKSLFDRAATKSAFLQAINQYPIVHLATHAVSDINNSADSYIAFYPEKKSKADNFLFLQELYGLNMNSTKLMIISACETGKGEWVNNEGVISLARAFAYAGCSSVVNSLWKADDQATAAILKKFHFYLQQGLTKSRALQKAKLDYLQTNTIYKNPGYWSGLVLIGDTAPLYQKRQPFGWAALITGSLSVLCFVWIKKKKKSRRFSRIKDSKIKLKTLSERTSIS